MRALGSTSAGETSAIERERRVVVGQSDVGRGPVGRDATGLLEQRTRLLELAALQAESAAEIGVVRPADSPRGARSRRLRFVALELGADEPVTARMAMSRCSSGSSPRSALVVSRKEQGAVGRAQQPHVHPHRVARPTNRALHHGLDAEVARKVGQRARRALGHGSRIAER